MSRKNIDIAINAMLESPSVPCQGMHPGWSRGRLKGYIDIDGHNINQTAILRK